MSELIVQEWGVDPVFQAADPAGDYWVNSGDVKIWVRNLGFQDKAIRFVGKGRCSHGFVDDLDETARSQVTAEFAPFPTRQFNEIGTRRAYIDYPDGVDNLQVAAQRQACG